MALCPCARLRDFQAVQRVSRPIPAEPTNDALLTKQQQAYHLLLSGCENLIKRQVPRKRGLYDPGQSWDRQKTQIAEIEAALKQNYWLTFVLGLH